MVEGDWTGLNTVKYMISLLLWIISIDLYTVSQHSLIKAGWNKPLPWMIRQCNEKVKHKEVETPLPFLNIQLTVSGLQP